MTGGDTGGVHVFGRGEMTLVGYIFAVVALGRIPTGEELTQLFAWAEAGYPSLS